MTHQTLRHSFLESGRIFVELELANDRDVIDAGRGLIPQSAVRRVPLRARVEPRTTRLGIPGSIAAKLGLEAKDSVLAVYGDGRRLIRPLAQGIHVKFAGREAVVNALLEPDMEFGRVGMIVMNELDVVVDESRGTLVPRDPRFTIAEI